MWQWFLWDFPFHIFHKSPKKQFCKAVQWYYACLIYIIHPELDDLTISISHSLKHSQITQYVILLWAEYTQKYTFYLLWNEF